MRFVVSCLVTLLCLGTTASFAAAPEPMTEEQKTLYALGLAINQSLGNFNLSEPEFEIVKSGIIDEFSKRPPQSGPPGVRREDFRTARGPRLSRRRSGKKAGAAFFAKVAAESGAEANRVRRDPHDH